MGINPKVLVSVLPLAGIDWLDQAALQADKWEINTPERLAAFLGQLAHESAQFTHLEENLSYSAERLLEVWPKRFPTPESAESYAHNPRALANKIYAGRYGNGPESTGDGYLYRGRGPIQTTFFNNYKAAGYGIGADFISHPEKLLIPELGIAAAAWYWKTHGCNELADINDIAAITKAVNGGDLGLKERIDWTLKILKVLE